MTEVNKCPPDGSLNRVASECNVIAAAAAEVCRPTIAGSGTEVKQVKCECCGLSEECTPGYIARVKELFGGHWLCGLCTEAVNEERNRIGLGAAKEEAIRSHMAVCVQFNKLARPNPAVNLADALKQILRRNLEPGRTSPRAKSLSRSASCIPAINRTNTPRSFSQKGSLGETT